MRELARTITTGAGGVTAAFLGSLCCAGPLVFALFGISAGLAGRFEPFRPLFGVLMLAAFGFGFHRLYRQRGVTSAPQGAACDVSAGDATGCDVVGCGVAPPLRRERIAYWSAAVLALVLWTLPTWSPLVLRR